MQNPDSRLAETPPTYPDLDPWQFRLTPTAEPGSVRVGALHLAVGPDIGCYALSDSTGVPLGYLIGFPMDLDAQTQILGDHQLGLSLGDDFDQFADDLISMFAGRFLWISTVPGKLRVYTDSLAYIPFVFDPSARIGGSSAHALLDDETYEARFQSDLSTILQIDKYGWFPGGLTAHRGIERLLPNHYLDLETWQVHRCWPRAEISETSDPEGHIAQIIDLIQRQYSMLLENGALAISLTGGRDTRMLLACAKPVKDAVTFVTVTGSDRHSMDTALARLIARREGLSHIELPRLTANPEARDHYIRLGGHCIADSNSWFFPSVGPLRQKYTMITGLGGEIGRAFFWKPSDKSATQLTPDLLIGRMGLRKDEVVIDRMADWISRAPMDNTLMNLDLFYIEERMGPWAAVQLPCDPTLLRLAPMVCRRIIRLMLELPDDWKREGRLADETVRQAWPELMRYKINTLGPMRDTMLKIQKVVADPSLIGKKLRKLTSR